MNRIDDIIMFSPLNKDEIKDIVRLQLDLLSRRLEEKNIIIKATEEAIELLADRGYDPQFGARPVKRVIQRDVLNELSKALLSSNVQKDDEILMDAFDEELIFRKNEEKVQD